ncbi:MAG: hypothetical protein ACJ0GY_09590 [Synechococcus sp.]
MKSEAARRKHRISEKLQLFVMAGEPRGGVGQGLVQVSSNCSQGSARSYGLIRARIANQLGARALGVAVHARG